jgi:hypothetical protein
MKVYKVRHAETKLYRTAGVRTYWNRVGKTWDTLGKLRTMITCAITDDRSSKHDFSNWEVVEYEVIEQNVRPVHEMITANKLLELIKK